MLYGQQDVDRTLVNIELNNLFELLLSNLTDSCLDLGDFPNENFTFCCAGDSFLCAGQENSLRVGLFFLSRVVLSDGSTVVLESLRLIGPLHEEDTVLAVTGELMWIHRVEFDPMGRANRLIVEFHGHLRAILILVCPVPQRARLGLVSAESRDVAVIS